MSDAGGDVTMADVGDGATDDGQDNDRHVDTEDLDEKYPNRPRNHSVTLPFHNLFTELFNPLQENRKKATGPLAARRKTNNVSPGDARRHAIERFFSLWKKNVGDDIYPAFRLIVPDKDRDRAMYGLKEKTIGKLLVRIMKIDKNSEDAQNLMNWKLPGFRATTAMAGDFAGRCYEVLKKRPMRTALGDLTVGDVNDMLDQLSIAEKENEQLPILEEFYRKMNPEEMMWLIRMILRQMKVGATEKTFFDAWHPDADNLFNVSSSLRRVCWELYDIKIRLATDDRGITIMSCFQPQLAAFQLRTIDMMVARMNLTDDDPFFWIEEKLDGERMQLHMVEDSNTPGGKRFAFWSRKAKDYTYMYGDGFEDEGGALTKHLKSCFHEGVRNIILDGEMITLDPESGALVPFGTLKTAVKTEQRNPFGTTHRPVFKVFDCLFLNDQLLTNYTLRDRRKALESGVKGVEQRLEKHKYIEGKTASEIEARLRTVVEASTEGLVIKNPRSIYRMNERNDDWLKVKPEYMMEYGEALDCIVIGAYYGSGHRGGRHSSFLCGLRVGPNHIALGAIPQKCLSFFRVGGGFTAGDYADIKQRTEGKWIKWDPKNPPTTYIELAGGHLQHERPDVWIKPEDSVVLEVKAAEQIKTDRFSLKISLRFPRFKRLRTDKDWKSALSVDEFKELDKSAQAAKEDKKFRIDDARKRRKAPSKSRKREITVAGQTQDVAAFAGPQTRLFEGRSFYILTECTKPKTSKEQLEQLVKSHGGQIVQTQKDSKTICIAERNVVKVASIKKTGDRNLIKPSWILDCIGQAESDVGRMPFMLPLEPRHMLHAVSGDFEAHVDEWGDSYTRDTLPQELKKCLIDMHDVDLNDTDTQEVMSELFPNDENLFYHSPGFLFRGLRIFVEESSYGATNENLSDGVNPSGGQDLERVRRLLAFGSAALTMSLDKETTHVVFGADEGELREVRKKIAGFSRLPRLVKNTWIEDSWRERTLLNEEHYVPHA